MRSYPHMVVHDQALDRDRGTSNLLGPIRATCPPGEWDAVLSQPLTPGTHPQLRQQENLIYFYLIYQE